MAQTHVDSVFPTLRIVDHPLVRHKITLLRDRATPTKQFKELVDEIAMLMAYEATRDLALEPTSVDTPLETTSGWAVRGKKLFVAPRGMPFEVVVAIEGWLKVRDRAGDMAWIERRQVSERRTVVSVATAQVRDKPEEGASVVLEVAGDVVLDLVEAAPATLGWIRVRHRDGASGFVRVSQVWGV
jgi:SH3-like domain-containing protein